MADAGAPPAAESKAKDIQARFEEAVVNGFDYEGALLSTQLYSNGAAPNPCLKIEGLGLIGLPLNGREAEEIMAKCLIERLPHHGSGWELRAKKVKFKNPEWQRWVEKDAGKAAVKNLTKTLSGVTPKYAFKKLIIQGPGQFQDSNENCKDKFGNLTFVLPSLFKGGQVELPHFVPTPTISLNPGNCLCTPVLATYSTLDLALSPVVSGYRMALQYDIIQPSSDACTPSDFEPGAFIGSDALLMRCLEPLATEFRLEIAFVRLAWGRKSDDPVDSVDSDSDYYEPEFYIAHLGSVNDSYSWQGIKRQRTVLVLWHRDGTLQATVRVGDISDYACAVLKKSNSPSPTAAELALVETFISSCTTPLKEEPLARAVQMLRDSAARWHDPILLLRVFNATSVDKNMHLLGIEGFLSCYADFGWEYMKEFFEMAMKNGQSNSARQSLLDRLVQVASEEDDAQLSAWCVSQQKVVLRFLRTLDAEHIPWLLQAVASRGDGFLRDIVFPQLLELKLSWEFWTTFMRRLEGGIDGISTATAEESIPKCVEEIARAISPFPTVVVRGDDPPYTKRAPEQTLEAIKLQCSVDISSSEFAPRLYYFDLSTSLAEYMHQNPANHDLPVWFRPCFIDAAEAILFPVVSRAFGLDRFSLDSNEIKELMDILELGGGLSPVRQRFNSERLRNYTPDTLTAVIQSISSHFTPQIQTDASQKSSSNSDSRQRLAQEDYTFVISGFVHALIKGLDLGSPGRRLMDVAHLCYDVGTEDQVPYLLTRALSLLEKRGSWISTDSHDLTYTLVPFILALAPYLADQGTNLGAPPLDFFPAAIVKAFAKHVMPEIHHGRQAEATRKHIEARFPKYNSPVRCTTIKSGVPHTLEVTKVPTQSDMTPRGMHEAHTNTGLELLAVLGDTATQGRILGKDYDFIFKEITREFDSNVM
ncbi:hypothetical protein DFH06DRAFT_1479444 [Mycena polygramma]|nr:hypothetical protein DFH06DRAFT_1479444 [Mycena polygramma]